MSDRYKFTVVMASPHLSSVVVEGTSSQALTNPDGSPTGALGVFDDDGEQPVLHVAAGQWVLVQAEKL